MAELTPEEKQNIYQEEKRRLEREAALHSPSIPVVGQKPKKKLSKNGIAAIIVFVGLAILFYVQRDKMALLKDLGNSDHPTPAAAYTPPSAQPSDHFTIKTNKFSTSHGYYEVTGDITNTSQKTFRYVQLKAIFFNQAQAVVGEDMTYACAEDYILPAGEKSFKFMGTKQSDYKSVRCEIVSCSEVR